MIKKAKSRLQCALYRRIQNSFRSSHQVLALLPPSSWCGFCITSGHWPQCCFRGYCYPNHGSWLPGPRSLPEGITMLRLPWCSTLCSCPAALLPFQAPPLPLLKLLFSLQRHLLAFMFFFKIQAKMTFWEQSYWVSVITIPLSVTFSVCAQCPLLYPPTTSSEKKLPLFTCLDTALPAHWAGQLHTNTQCPGGDSFRG